jgi:KUP system potassium uptake protein
LVGAALLYGDGVITPTISVLSAVEGLKVDAPQLAPAVVPLSIMILVGLFLIQQGHGVCRAIGGAEAVGALVLAVCHLSSHDGIEARR